ncbi:MAG: PAS domain S-box protein [Anaerolineae bacterium]|nr:PAS domain S-box protein [Anaerolineae bacterium]
MPLIVVAHDEPDTRLMLRQALEQDRYEVLEADSGGACITAVYTAKPDLVLIDSGLQGPDALTTCAHLRAVTHMPILMIADDGFIDTAFTAGASDVISWPLRPTILRYRLRHLLEMADVMALRQQEAWYRSVVENAVGGIFRSTPEGRFIMVNQAMISLLGYDTLEEVLALQLPDDVYADPSVRERMRQEHEFHGVIKGVETVFKCKDGRLIDVSIHARVIKDAQGNTLFFDGIIQDITENKRMATAEHQQRILAEALRDIAAALNSTLDTDQVLDRILLGLQRVVPHDLSNIFLIENDIAQSVRRSGYVQRKVDHLVASMRLNVRETATLRDMITTRKPLIIPDVVQYPGWFVLPEFAWVRSFIGAPIQIGNEVLGFLLLDSGTTNAFTELHAEALAAFANQAGIAMRNARLYEAVRRHAEELGERVMAHTADLENKRAQLQAVLDSMGEGVITFTTDGVYGTKWYFNQAMQQMTGYFNPSDGLEVFHSQHLNNDDFGNLIAEMTDSALDSGLWKGEMRMRRADNTEFDASLTVTRINKPTGEFVGTVTIVRDISQEKALQAQKSRFVASASHELRTPITSLKARLYLAQRQPERLDTHLRVFEQAVDRIQELVESLLDLSRFERGVFDLERVTLDVKVLVQEVVTLMEVTAQNRSLSLITELPTRDLYVLVDPARLHQVLNNLVGNAINYTEPGGQIIVRVLIRQDDEMDYAVIQVEDNGSGIAGEHLPYIFEPFYRARSGSGGMGLGLSISKEIVERHGGKLTVASEMGKGTCFSVWLRLVEEVVTE